MTRRIAVTLGDPAGIGPEVALKALHHLPSFKKNVVLLGPADFYTALARRLRLKLRFADVKDVSESPASNAVRCFFPESLPATVTRGKSDNRLTRLAVRSIELAVTLAMQKKIAAVVTAPINKAGLKQAGFRIPGHTEYLAELSGTKKFEMMLVGANLRVVLVTRHLALAKVPRALTRRRVREAILMADRELRISFGIKKPRIVVCGLNPHAGEKGSIGSEEIRVIGPAVKEAARRISGTLTGPLSPDSLFHDAYLGRYDAEICMYHDQGLIPLKMISRGHGVNVTLGLPFIRTSPDHGTGYDIASRFIADPGSMIAALHLALSIHRNRSRGSGR